MDVTQSKVGLKDLGFSFLFRNVYHFFLFYTDCVAHCQTSVYKQLILSASSCTLAKDNWAINWFTVHNHICNSTNAAGLYCFWRYNSLTQDRLNYMLFTKTYNKISNKNYKLLLCILHKSALAQQVKGFGFESQNR